ncbi:MAG: hypothetical protein U9R25_00525 [Chloroflexota bacterium]|nr:hypothetical protein [Chloroflexota bacterium]
MRLPRNVLRYGAQDSLPEKVSLRAGPLALIYQAGDLRYVRLGDQEILRRVYVAVRDKNWGTVAPVLTNERLEIDGDRFQITYDAHNREGGIDFRWHGVITGAPDGTITFSMDGQAHSTFLRSRIGFCVLHPMRCAGALCQIEHVDGTTDDSAFPMSIAPQLIVDGQVKPLHPFEEMRAVKHQVQANLWAGLRFEGDIFEMEDQRNWTDASFKTYSTPLRLPFPVEVSKGTRIFQRISLALEGNVPLQAQSAGQSAVTISLGKDAGRRLPRVGLGIASHGMPLTENELERLAALNLAHLRVGVRLSHSGYQSKLRQAIAEARQLDVALEIALFLSNNAQKELTEFARILQNLKPPVWAWLIFHDDEAATSNRWVGLARDRLATYDPTARFGAGTNQFFTQLNQVRPQMQASDLACYSVNPQVHAFDNSSLMETLAAQAATVKSAQQITGNLPIAVTPVTLKMRFNPYASEPEEQRPTGQLPAEVDERQMSLFGAGWTLGSLKFLAEAGALSTTYFETVGWRGVMETQAGSPLPEYFQSIPGSVFPVYHVLADVGEFAGGEVIPTESRNPLLVDSLAMRYGNRVRVLVANLSNEMQQVATSGLPGRVDVRVLDETNGEEAMRFPETFRLSDGEVTETSAGTLTLNLRPYAIARIDSIEK